MAKNYVKKVPNPFKLLLKACRAYRSLCYWQARRMGDVIAILSGPKAMGRRFLRKKGLQITSSWSRHV